MVTDIEAVVGLCDVHCRGDGLEEDPVVGESLRIELEHGEDHGPDLWRRRYLYVDR